MAAVGPRVDTTDVGARDLDKRLSRQIPLQQYLWQPMRVQYCSGRTGKAPHGPITAVVTQPPAHSGEVKVQFLPKPGHQS